MVVDVDVEKFIKNIDSFVAQVKQVDYLNLFINSLKDDQKGRELEFFRPSDDEDLIRESHNE